MMVPMIDDHRTGRVVLPQHLGALVETDGAGAVVRSTFVSCGAGTGTSALSINEVTFDADGALHLTRRSVWVIDQEQLRYLYTFKRVAARRHDGGTCALYLLD